MSGGPPPKRLNPPKVWGRIQTGLPRGVPRTEKSAEEVVLARRAENYRKSVENATRPRSATPNGPEVGFGNGRAPGALMASDSDKRSRGIASRISEPSSAGGQSAGDWSPVMEPFTPYFGETFSPQTATPSRGQQRWADTPASATATTNDTAVAMKRIKALNSKFEFVAQRLRGLEARTKQGADRGTVEPEDGGMQRPDGVAELKGSVSMEGQIKQTVSSIQETLFSLNKVYRDSQHLGDSNEEYAASIITNRVRGWIVWRKFKKAIVALKTWQKTNTEPVQDRIKWWVARRERINAHVTRLCAAHYAPLMRAVFDAWQTDTAKALAGRINRRQRAFFLSVKQERARLREILTSWAANVSDMKHGKYVALKNQSRYEAVSQQVRLGEEGSDNWRPEVFEAAVRVALRQEAISVIEMLHQSIVTKTSFHAWRVHVRQRLRHRTILLKCRRHYHSKLSKKHFATWREDVAKSKAIDEVRFQRKTNQRRLVVLCNDNVAKGAFYGWISVVDQSKDTAKFIKKWGNMVLKEVFQAFEQEVRRQRQLRLAAVQRWMLISRYKVHYPFRCWFLWTAEHRFRRKATAAVFQVLRKRWGRTLMRRIHEHWRLECNSQREKRSEKPELLKLLAESQELTRTLNENVEKYKDLYELAEKALKTQEELLVTREKEILDQQQRTSSLELQLHAASQEILRLKELVEKGPSLKMLRLAAQELGDTEEHVLLTEDNEAPAKPRGKTALLLHRAGLIPPFTAGEPNSCLSARHSDIGGLFTQGGQPRSREFLPVRRSGSFSVSHQNEEVVGALPISEELLLARAKYVLERAPAVLNAPADPTVTSTRARAREVVLMKELFELLSSGTINGTSVDLSGYADMAVLAEQTAQLPPHHLRVTEQPQSSLSWNQFLIGLDRQISITAPSARLGKDAKSSSTARDKLVERIANARRAQQSGMGITVPDKH
mmetsp:Transcript_35227/g.80409  ORF Transcript_35227/g.80409 Transcript_35227/m.80409 type:complete len:950 (+) Transcript_35227:72-2921(+)